MLAVLIILPAGRAADSMPFKILIPVSFGLLSLGTTLFYFLEAPDTWEVYFVCSLVVISAMLTMTSLETCFSKNLPKDIRGTMNGVQACCGTLGAILFSKLGGYLYDE